MRFAYINYSCLSESLRLQDTEAGTDQTFGDEHAVELKAIGIEIGDRQSLRRWVGPKGLIHDPEGTPRVLPGVK